MRNPSHRLAGTMPGVPSTLGALILRLGDSGAPRREKAVC